MTDGAIGFETEVVAHIRTKLPASSRLHTIGVGSAVNRSLTHPAARAGRGVEVVIGLGDDPEKAAQRLLRHTAQPAVVNLELSGSALSQHVPARLPDLFASAPVLVGAKLKPQGGDILVRGMLPNGERWSYALNVPETAKGSGRSAILRFFGRELVDDLELELAAGASQHEIDPLVERAGLQFRIATRLTSWVAVSEEPSVDPTEPMRRARMPHELPYGTSVEGLGLRSAASFAPRGMAAVAPRSMAVARLGARQLAGPPMMPRSMMKAGDGMRGFDDAEGAPEPVDGVAMLHDLGLVSREVFGTVVLSKQRALVISVTIADMRFEWSPREHVVVEWSDGKTAEARVVPQRTTAPGTVTIGQTVRLWLEFSEDLPAAPPALVRIDAGDGELIVRLLR